MKQLIPALRYHDTRRREISAPLISRSGIICRLVILIWVTVICPGISALPLNPLNLSPSLGPFPNADGTYTIDSQMDHPVLLPPGGGAPITGEYHNGIAVFIFDEIKLGKNMTF